MGNDLRSADCLRHDIQHRSRYLSTHDLQSKSSFENTLRISQNRSLAGLDADRTGHSASPGKRSVSYSASWISEDDLNKMISPKCKAILYEIGAIISCAPWLLYLQSNAIQYYVVVFSCSQLWPACFKKTPKINIRHITDVVDMDHNPLLDTLFLFLALPVMCQNFIG